MATFLNLRVQVQVLYMETAGEKLFEKSDFDI